MAWLYLLLSAVLEPVWAFALADSRGFTVLWPTVVFFVAMTLGSVLLALAAKEIPMSTAYGVWTGIGAVLTVAWGIVTGTETASAARLMFLAMIVVAVVGLKVVTPPREANRAGVELE